MTKNKRRRAKARRKRWAYRWKRHAVSRSEYLASLICDMIAGQDRAFRAQATDWERFVTDFMDTMCVAVGAPGADIQWKDPAP